MRILSMTATFGKLDGETLTFREGLNIIAAPNEWGKSTWCTFLVAMFYGIDTRERTTRDSIADKEKYAPWSGKPMEGTLRLLHGGRDITIQRRSTGRVPLGDFLAYETQTGLRVPELTAENCGQVLLGVEKSVFQRTGFLRFTELPVKQDEHLRRRLNALVTTGDESGNGDLLGTKLRELKNKCRYNQTGLIPECQKEIRELQEELWQRQTLQKQHDSLLSQVHGQEEELEALELHREHLLWLEAREDQKRLTDARLAADAAEQYAAGLAEKLQDSSDREEVEGRIRQGRKLLEDLELSLEEEPQSSLGALVTAILAGILLLAAIFWADRGLLWPCIVTALVLLCATFGLLGRRRRARLRYRIEQTRLEGKRDALVKYVESWNGTLRAIDQLEAARDTARQARLHAHDLEAMARAAQGPEPEEDLTLTREETLQRISDLTAAISRSRLQLAQYRGRMDSMQDAEILQGKISLSQHRLKRLENYYQSIGYAQQALEAAMQELQRRFAPRITRRAGQHLSRLTGGLYNRISIGEDLTIQAARGNEVALRSAQWRSEGTGDQMYLALRLAVWEVLAPKSPLILDDALIRFDQARLEKALELLSELGNKQQILLFSCQSREKEWLLKR